MMKLKKYLIRETQFNYDELLRADVNSDGEVNSTDYAYLKRYILRIIDAFPHNQNLKFCKMKYKVFMKS